MVVVLKAFAENRKGNEPVVFRMVADFVISIAIPVRKRVHHPSLDWMAHDADIISGTDDSVARKPADPKRKQDMQQVGEDPEALAIQKIHFKKKMKLLKKKINHSMKI